MNPSREQELAVLRSVIYASLFDYPLTLEQLESSLVGVRANAITPGYIRTPGTEAMYADPEIYEGRRKGVPMGRVGSGDDIAGPAIFLASDDSQYTTGSVVGGTRQILLAVVASSITLVVVFAPLLYLRGLARAIFAEQAIAVVASVLAVAFRKHALSVVGILAAVSALGGA